MKHDCAEALTLGRVYELRIELLPMSAAVRERPRLRMEISNWESAITEAPMTHWCCRKVGTGTSHHSAVRLRR